MAVNADASFDVTGSGTLRRHRVPTAAETAAEDLTEQEHGKGNRQLEASVFVCVLGIQEFASMVLLRLLTVRCSLQSRFRMAD